MMLNIKKLNCNASASLFKLSQLKLICKNTVTNTLI